MPAPSRRVALIQASCEVDRPTNVDRAEAAIRQAGGSGAEIVCLQELFDSRYFPQRVEVDGYGLAEPLPSATTIRMQALARELGIVLIVPVYEEAAPGVCFNTAVVIDADGAELGKYRKMHIPDGPQYHEKFYFTPGNLGYPVWKTAFGTIGVAICWDEWFPEVARILALRGAEILFYPSAIGSEPDRPDFSSAEAWRIVLRSHGIANGVFVAALNRVGQEDGMRFYGQSFISDPFGEVVAEAGETPTIVSATLDMAKVRELRQLLQFFRDRRAHSYAPLCETLPESE